MWVYQNKKIENHEDLDPKCTDIVYCLEFDNSKRYIGKKTVRSMRRKTPTKAQKRIRKNYVRKEWVDLPFLNYQGSSEETKALVCVRKEILYQCSTKKAATYLEAAMLFYEDALFDPTYLNKNISGRFFPNDLDGLIETDELP